MALIGAIFGEQAGYSAENGDLVRVTSSFDARYAPAVLKVAAKPWSGGYGRAEAERVSREIDGLRADQARSWRFAVRYQGVSVPLEIRAQVDDLGMIDLDFTTSPGAAPALRAAIDGYLNRYGR